MASASGFNGTTAALRRWFPEFAFGLGVVCLLGMVPVTLGSLAGYLSLAAAIPVLGVVMAVAVFSLVAA
ncbi:hypothetical protein [Halolamina sp.]|jgi:hypothetical protein|uniref:hypothetical protein n=1 Tax=Halolamina sp. TaxID=1940283 RepID=UPI000223BD34|nr:hypothetical protein Halar_3164 [halophilic archaeon DL31]